MSRGDHRNPVVISASITVTIFISVNKRDIRCQRHRVSQECVPDFSLDNDSPPENDIDKGNRLKGQVKMQRQRKSVIQSEAWNPVFK